MAMANKNPYCQKFEQVLTNSKMDSCIINQSAKSCSKGFLLKIGKEVKLKVK